LFLPFSFLKAQPKIPTVPARDIQDTNEVYFPSHLQILMKTTRGKTVEHLTVQQQPYFIRSNLEALFYHRDTDVLFILVVKGWVGDNAGGTACVLKKISAFLYLAPILLSFYQIIETVLPTLTRF